MRTEGAPGSVPPRVAALVAGAASGLGAASARLLHASGFHVVAVDLDGNGVEELAAGLGKGATAVRADISNGEDVAAAIAAVPSDLPLRAVVVCAGVGHVERIIGREAAHSAAGFRRTIEINLIGSFNLLTQGAMAIGSTSPDRDGERGAIVLTSSVAAFDGQIGQIAYSASKAAVAGMVLPAARDLAASGIRVCAIAPGTFETPLLAGLPQRAREGLAAQVPFPKRLGDPPEFAALVQHVLQNKMLNGEVIRLDGALRMPPS
ncbi:MAG TPA: SDR family NAD(P)-dependent oxidoreductase [Solirubrobacterales bacterium]